MASLRGEFDLSDVLEMVEAASPVDAVDAVTSRLAAALDADRVALLIADLAGRAVVRLGNGDGPADARRIGADSAETLPLTDPVVAEVLSGQDSIARLDEDRWRLLAPVSQRGEAIGLLEVILADEPDADAVRAVERAAHLLAFAVIANRRHTDLYEWGQRTTRFELSAEIQRRLLPGALTCEGGEFTLSAWLEPAATIAGDTFDYSVSRDVLHLSVTDAMGHGVASALTATLCVGSLRNSRRAGLSLEEQATAADAAMREYGETSFVTGLVGRIDLHTGLLTLVNAGHVPPFLLREDQITQLSPTVNRPFGLSADREYRRTEIALQPGDRLAIVTDGMLERRASELPLPEMLAQTRSLHPREATRHLADTVLDIAGPELADDATILMVDWHGEFGRRRDSWAGADRS